MGPSFITPFPFDWGDPRPLLHRLSEAISSLNEWHVLSVYHQRTKKSDYCVSTKCRTDLALRLLTRC